MTPNDERDKAAEEYIEDTWAPHIRRFHNGTEQWGKFLTVQDAYKAGWSACADSLLKWAREKAYCRDGVKGCKRGPDPDGYVLLSDLEEKLGEAK